MLTHSTTTTEAAAPPLALIVRRAGYGGRTSSLKGRWRDRYRDGLRPPLPPETSTAPNRRTARAGQRLPDLARGTQDPNELQDHHNQVSTVSGDCRYDFRLGRACSENRTELIERSRP
jgi:hypothetical protein